MKIMPLKNFENYSISENGNIFKTCKNGKIINIKPWINNKNPNDYLRVSLHKDGKQHKFLLHRLIALHFIPNYENKAQVNHKDGNRQNNSINNLEWVTNSENQIHSVKVTKTWKHPNPMNGKFGIEHNCSKPFIIEFPNGTKKKFFGENEMVRELGFGRTSISWARCKKFKKYKFTKGKMSGLIVHF